MGKNEKLTPKKNSISLRPNVCFFFLFPPAEEAEGDKKKKDKKKKKGEKEEKEKKKGPSKATLKAMQEALAKMKEVGHCGKWRYDGSCCGLDLR